MLQGKLLTNTNIRNIMFYVWDIITVTSSVGEWDKIPLSQSYKLEYSSS